MSTDWSCEELSERIGGEEIFLVDVRNEDEYARCRIEGPSIEAVNIPYFTMLEAVEGDDVVGGFEALLGREWGERLPRDRRVLAVCAKGDTSEYVAEALRRLGRDAANLAGGMAAWGNHYTTRRVVVDNGLAIYQVARPARGCLGYLVAAGSSAFVIDPARHLEPYETLAREIGTEIEWVVDTHAHADHLTGGPALASRLEVPYRLHPYDAIHPVDVLPARVEFEPLWEGAEVPLDGTSVRALHAPGHTLGNLALLLDGRYLFSGDSIFLCSIARPDLGGHGESWARLHHRSLRELLALPAETLVLPGHFSDPADARPGGVYAAPLGELARSNPGLARAAESEESFVAYILESLPELPEEYVEIKRINAGLAEADEERRAELELGKNVCAMS